MSEQHGLAEPRFAAARHDLERNAGKLRHLEGERHQRRPRLGDPEAEPPRGIMRETRSAHLRDGKAAGRQHNASRIEIIVIGGDAEAIGFLDRRDAMGDPDIDARRGAFGQHHRHDLPCRAVAEKLAQGLLVPGDAMLVDQRDEIVLRVAGQRRFAEVRVLRQERAGIRVQIGEVAAPAARDQDLLADLLGVIEQQHTATALAGAHRAHQAGRSGTNEDDIEREGGKGRIAAEDAGGNEEARVANARALHHEPASDEAHHQRAGHVDDEGVVRKTRTHEACHPDIHEVADHAADAGADEDDEVADHVRNSPPFTWMVWPVMKAPSGPTSRRTMAAISSTLPRRPSGIGRPASGRGPADAARAVSMAPGATALQVILCGASSRASARIRPSRPALEADTWQRFRVPTWVETPDMATKAPPLPLATICGMKALPSRKAPSSATDMISRHSSNDMSRNGVWRLRPALLTRMSTPPNCFCACSASLAVALGSETSPIAAAALPPAFSISATTPSTATLSERPLTSTAAPSHASVSAMARPIFLPAPVTSATLPCRGRDMQTPASSETTLAEFDGELKRAQPAAM